MRGKMDVVAAMLNVAVLEAWQVSEGVPQGPTIAFLEAFDLRP